MNVSKQELDDITSSVICEISFAWHRVKLNLWTADKDDMEIADSHISAILNRVIDFRDKHKFPALLADQPYREARQQARQKEIKELVDRFAANQSDIERLQEHNNHIQDRLKQLEKETI
jgi:membrane protein involved in colicin uptake